MRTYTLLRNVAVAHGAFPQLPALGCALEGASKPMAIYHLSTKIVTRSGGRSSVAAAAYRAAESLADERSGLTHDYTAKGGVDHTEILAPASAPAWANDRAALWNAVETAEKRRDAQLAREVEVALPKELGDAEQVELLRDFVRSQFVARGMVADIAVHRDNSENPHAHVLLTMRTLGADGFGQKDRSWNDRKLLLEWREAWASHTNRHLAQAGVEARVDHRSHAALGLDLTPSRKIGVGVDRQESDFLPDYIRDRMAEQQRIAFENGEHIIAKPEAALDALTRQHATFTRIDVAKFLHTRTDGAEQFQHALATVLSSKELVALGADDRGEARLTTRELLEIERRMGERVQEMAGNGRHALADRYARQVLAGSKLSAQQREAFEYVTAAGDVRALVGVAGAGKSTLLAATREAWEAQGYNVKGAALSGIAAQNLEQASGINSRTIASYELSWSKDRDRLTSRDVLVVDEAGMIGTRQLSRVLEHADRAGAKVVLVGDPEQLQAIEAGSPFRSIAMDVGGVELSEVRRQERDWQREATRLFSSGRTAEALRVYDSRGMIKEEATRAEARESAIDQWNSDRVRFRDQSQLLLAYTREDVTELNRLARGLQREAGELGRDHTIETERGKREFAAGDRIYFLRNEKSLGVKNGTLGTIERIQGPTLAVRVDGDEEKRIAVDTRFYNQLDYGYAGTVHKSQGSTVDRAYVIASPHFDRHAAYVAMSRHRREARLYYGRDQIADRVVLSRVLGRARVKEMASQYLEQGASAGAVGSWAGPHKLKAQYEQWKAKRQVDLQNLPGKVPEKSYEPKAPARGPGRDRGYER